MKIVQINAVYGFSSTGRTTKEMHQYFLDKGIESYVFCAGYQNENQNIYKIGNRIDYKLHALFSRIMGLQGYFSHYSTYKLIKHEGVSKQAHPLFVSLSMPPYSDPTI